MEKNYFYKNMEKKYISIKIWKKKFEKKR